MALKKEEKQEMISKFGKHETDTGSSEVQIALLTKKINQLLEHLKKNKKDQLSRRGLLVMVGQRKRLLNYLRDNDEKKYDHVVAELSLG